MSHSTVHVAASDRSQDLDPAPRAEACCSSTEEETCCDASEWASCCGAEDSATAVRSHR